MSQRDAMRRSAARFLRPGETIQVVFGARTVVEMAAGPALAALIDEQADRNRIIAVTDQRILMLRAGPLQRKAHSMMTGLSRSRLLGPPSGWRYEFDLGPEKLRVGRRFFPDIQAADGYLTPADRQGT